MIVSIIRLLTAVVLAYAMGKLVSKARLPEILGWLLAGMILGPHAINIVDSSLLQADWYKGLLNVLECSVGLMIGTELIFKDIKKSGKQIVITTLTQSLGTFLIVSVCFGIVFYFTAIPSYVAFIFGGIALATAPAPALSIVQEFKTDGPVTRTLIPMAALDDIVGIIVFFSVISIVTATNTEKAMPLALTLGVMVLLPVLIGLLVGFLAGAILKKEGSKEKTLFSLVALILLCSGLGFVFNNYILPQPILNFMIIGMSFSATFTNMVSDERLGEILAYFDPILGLAMLVVILNLGAPLDYHLILGAGAFTVIYILSRGVGKWTGAFLGSKATKMPETVQKYLGFTLLPHSGVSLIFTGIAVTTLSTFDPVSAGIVQGTIAAAAVINEVIAVIIAKKAFEWSGEFGKLKG